MSPAPPGRRRGRPDPPPEELEVGAVVVPLRRGADPTLVALAVGSFAVTLALASILALVLADAGPRAVQPCSTAVSPLSRP